MLVGCGRLHFDNVPTDGLGGDAGADASVGGGLTFGDFATCPATVGVVGAAAYTNGDLELTPDMPGVAGAAWFTSQFAITPMTRISIQLTFQFTFGVTPAAGDGAAIVLSADPRGITALGSRGGSLGYEFITPSVALELDTGFNATYNDLNSNHVGIDRDGSLTSVVQQDAGAIILSGGTPLTVWLDYDGPTTTVRGYLATTATKPATPLVTANDDLRRLGSAWIGLTAGTASDSERHDILAWRFDYTP
jgi:hypothetical protein